MKNDCRNAKLHFHMTFSLSSTSCLRKLPFFMREATSVIVNKRKISWCVSAAWRNQDFDFSNKNSTIFVLKVRKLDDEVIDIGREFQMLGPWERIVNCLNLCDKNAIHFS